MLGIAPVVGANVSISMATMDHSSGAGVVLAGASGKSVPGRGGLTLVRSERVLNTPRTTILSTNGATFQTTSAGGAYLTLESSPQLGHRQQQQQQLLQQQQFISFALNNQTPPHEVASHCDVVTTSSQQQHQQHRQQQQQQQQSQLFEHFPRVKVEATSPSISQQPSLLSSSSLSSSAVEVKTENGDVVGDVVVASPTTVYYIQTRGSGGGGGGVVTLPENLRQLAASTQQVSFLDQ